MGKERSNSRSRKSVLSTSRNTREREKQFLESQISFENFQKYNGKKRKGKSSSQSLKSVSSTFRNKEERKEKKKAVPRVSNQFRVLSEVIKKERKRKEKSSSRSLKSVSSTLRNKKERWEEKEPLPGVSNLV